MRWFRKEPKGRHALGAAVTAVPSGPVVTPLPLVPAQSVAPASATPAVLHPDVPPLPVQQRGSSARPPLQRTVTAPPPDLDPLVAPLELIDVLPRAEPLAVDDAARAAGAAASPVRSWQPAVVPAAPVQAPRVTAAAPSSPAPAPLLVDDVARRLPEPPSRVAAPAPAPVPPPSVHSQSSASGPRVELGFADGSSRLLDPQSSAAQRLNDLVGELVRPSRTDGSAGR